MKKFSRITALVLLMLLMALLPSVGAAAQGPVKYDPDAEGILSAYYPVENGFIMGVTPGTSAQKLCSTCVPAGVMASSEMIVTGTTVTSGNATLTAIVTGDLNGDGKITITDMLKLKSAVLGEQLTATAAAAGDMNYDGKVSVTDFLKSKSYLLGMTAVEPASANGDLLLMLPGGTDLWQPAVQGVASYESEDASLVTIDSTGAVTAAQSQGSCFVYAFDAAGVLLARQQVTVLNEPLTVSVGKAEVHLTIGQSETLKTVFNHPVAPQVSWTSSNPGVVSVANGVLTAKGVGNATVTASLNNGQSTQVAVTVAPPITDLNIERVLYKVKPGHTKSLLLQVTPADSGEQIIWTSSDPTIATVSADGVVTGVDYGTVTVTATGKYSGLTDSCDVKVCDVKQVAITFDDGPAPRTDDLLDFLKENDIRVTFFLVANRMYYYSDEVKREAAEGHEIGYHSYDHSTQTALSSSRIISDFEKSDAHLFQLTGQHFTVWRTPGGAYNNRVLSCVPLPHILWSEDTVDWKTLNAYAVYSSIISRASDGDIILMHDLHSTTVDGAIRAMKEMNAGDYEFVTVTELLSRDGTPPENSKNYNHG